MTFFRGVILFLLLVLTVAMVAIAYFLYQRQSGLGPVRDTVTTPSQHESGDAANSRVSETPVADSVPATGLVIDISTLPTAQQGVLRSLGYEQTITFTPDMIACAEAKLGSARVTEIKRGAAPSVLESASLMGCI